MALETQRPDVALQDGGTVVANQGTAGIDPWVVTDADVAALITASNAGIGAPADAEAAGNGSIIAILKRLRTLLAGGLPAALSASGNLKVAVLEEPAASTSARTSVNASATVVTVLAANTDRKGATIINDSVSRMCLALGSSASFTDYTELLEPRGYYEVPALYTGIITGIWAYAIGAAKVTELE